MKPNDDNTAAPGGKEAENQKKGKTKRTTRKKETKKKVKSVDEDHDLQDEGGADFCA